MTKASTGIELARRSITKHSKSFSLASRLLPRGVRQDAMVVYAWCRRVDDAVDLSPASEHTRVLARLRAELDSLFSGEAMADPVLAEMQRVVRERDMPRYYLDEMLAGMQMDADGVVYETHEQLLTYCFRVAGTVGLMMCHVMGVKSDRALRHAAHLGMAMQLTNISRDVAEDWGRGRLYVPGDLFRAAGEKAPGRLLPGRVPGRFRAVLAGALAHLLDEADRLYRSGDEGISSLGVRSAIAVRVARLVYADIGRVIRRRGCDVFAGRAYVSKARKLWLVARALVSELASRVRGPRPAQLRCPGGPVLYPADIHPLPGA